ncbi:MAG: alginate lyase family protein [Acidobacteriaceae bacterium]|nr:alginate lyase family protein [Acidobacteriaceae bacterium]
MRFVVAVLALTSLFPSWLAAQSLRPTAGLVEVARQPEVLARFPEMRPVVEKLYHCTATDLVPSPEGRIEIPHHYLSGSSGPINPAEHAATVVYQHFEERIAAGADQFVARGDHREAACALEQLDAWAKGKALLDYDPQQSSQAWYQVEWTLAGAGTAMTTLINDPQLDPAEVRRVTAWLDRAAARNISFERPGKDNNNHHYWRALAATSIGIVADDRTLFDFGVRAYKEAIGDVDERGAFPKEMARHENAIHYQMFALQPLVVIAQLAERQGGDLWSYSAHGRSLRDAIVFFGRAVEDPSLVKPYTSDEQKMHFSPGDYAQFALYMRHFGKEGLPEDIVKNAERPSFNSRLGGTLLLYALK